MQQEKIEIKDDAVGIVCPIYAGDMPKMVHRFLEKADIETDYFFFDDQISRACRDIAERKREEYRVTLAQKASMAVIWKMIGKTVLSDKAAQKYTVSDACTRCGICMRVCPAGNIRLTDRITFGDQCKVCYACIHNCPQNAIHLPDEKSGIRFRNEHVSVPELIRANCQRK